jgi:predicted dehydrogenase
MAINRRNFIKTSSALAAGMVFPTFAKAVNKQPSANDMINVAVIGCKNRGMSNLWKFLIHKDIRCAALCDINDEYLSSRASQISNRYGYTPDIYKDYRKVLDRKDIDIVIIGTPDHWHCLQFADSCLAGKDIYIEKPLANSIAECDVMTKIAKKHHNVIISVGQQQRSGKLWLEMIEYLNSGKLGKIGRIHVWANFNYGAMAPPVPDSDIPTGIDYDTWLGPAPELPFNERRFRGWRMFFNYGGGLMTDWGVHLLDMGLWAMDIKTMPLKIFSSGDNYMVPAGAQETFDTMSVIYQFQDFLMEWENNGGVETGTYGKTYGLFFKGTNGTLVANRDSWEVYPEKEKIPAVTVLTDNRDHQDHVDNFLNCVKTRNNNTACTIENGSLCAKYAHLGNIGARMGGAALIYDDKSKKFDLSTANKYIKPSYRNPWKFPGI